MKSNYSNKLTVALFLIGILSLTFFTQSTVLRKKYTSFYTSDCTWALKSPMSPSADAKKQLPVSTNIVEEEDKIVEEIIIACESHPILISLSYAFRFQLFEEPLLK